MNSPRLYRFADVTVDVSDFRILKSGSKVEAEPRAIQVLVFLIENRGRVVTKDELIKSVWNDTFVTDNALTRVIAQLRKALGDDAREPRFIETVHTQGYRFLAPVETGAPAAVRPRWIWAAPAVLAGIVWAVWPGSAPKPAAMNGTAPYQLTTSDGLDVWPSFSPDGTLLAYASDRTGPFEIWVRPVGGGEEVQVTRNGGQNVHPDWSPDGQTLAFHSMRDGGIWTIPALGGLPRRLTDTGCEPSWAPDGRRIAYRSGDVVSFSPPDSMAPWLSAIWVASLDGSPPVRVTKPGAPAGSHGRPDWSASGRLLFMAGSIRQGQIHIVEPDLRSIRELKVDPGPWLHAIWSNDGDSIYAASLTPELATSVRRIRVDNPADSGAVVWIANAAPRDLAISRNGQRLAMAQVTMASAIWRIPADGAGPAGPVTRNSMARNIHPAISPDGTRMAFQGIRRGLRGDIFVMPTAGGAEVQVTRDPDTDIHPNWTADGESLVFTSQRNNEVSVWRLRLSDGREEKLASAVGSPARLAPDGRLLYMRKAPEGAVGLWVAKPGEPERRISPVGVSVGFGAWSRGGDAIAAELFSEGMSAAVVLSPSGDPTG